MKKAILTLLMIPAFVGMLFSCSEVKTEQRSWKVNGILWK